MTGRIYFILTLTLLTGMSAGAYLYVTAFAPTYEQDDIQQTSEMVFLLQGQKRGGCNQEVDSCPSFELRADRSYSYIPQDDDSITESEMINGALGKDKFETLLAYIDSLDLRALEEKAVGECSNLYDTNYAYRLVYQGESYLYDTCNTAFKNSVLAVKFYPLWTRLATSTPIAPLLEEGLSGFLQKQLDKRFDYDD